jgi:hypothetical protein
MAAPVNAVTDTVLVVVVAATELALLVVEEAEMLLLAGVGTDFVVERAWVWEEDALGEELVALTEVEEGLDEDVEYTGAIVEVDAGVADSEVNNVAVASGKVKLRRLAQLEGVSDLYSLDIFNIIKQRQHELTSLQQ